MAYKVYGACKVLIKFIFYTWCFLKPGRHDPVGQQNRVFEVCGRVSGCALAVIFNKVYPWTSCWISSHHESVVDCYLILLLVVAEASLVFSIDIKSEKFSTSSILPEPSFIVTVSVAVFTVTYSILPEEYIYL